MMYRLRSAFVFFILPFLLISFACASPFSAHAAKDSTGKAQKNTTNKTDTSTKDSLDKVAKPRLTVNNLKLSKGTVTGEIANDTDFVWTDVTLTLETRDTKNNTLIWEKEISFDTIAPQSTAKFSEPYSAQTKNIQFSSYLKGIHSKAPTQEKEPEDKKIKKKKGIKIQKEPGGAIKLSN